MSAATWQREGSSIWRIFILFQDDRHITSRFDANGEIQRFEQPGLLDGVDVEIMFRDSLRAPSSQTLVEQNGYIPAISKAKCNLTLTLVDTSFGDFTGELP